MKSQIYDDIIVMSKLIISNNKNIQVDSDQGFVTRLIAIWMKINFREPFFNNKSWDYQEMDCQFSFTNWALQRLTKIYCTGLEDDYIIRGLFLLNRHYFCKYHDEDKIICLKVSNQYKKDTISLLNKIDPFFKFLNLCAKEKIDIKNVDSSINYINKKYNLRWNEHTENNIKQRLIENKNKQ